MNLVELPRQKQIMEYVYRYRTMGRTAALDYAETAGMTYPEAVTAEDVLGLTSHYPGAWRKAGLRELARSH